MSGFLRPPTGLARIWAQLENAEGVMRSCIWKKMVLALLLAAGGCQLSARHGSRKAETSPFFRQIALSHPGSGPAILAVDDADVIWVALAKEGKLARFSNGHVELFSFPPDARPVGVAVPGPGNPQHGSVWVAASYNDKLVRFDTVSRTLRQYALPGTNNWPFNVAVGPDGSVWFTQRYSGRIGRLDANTGHIRNYPLPNRASGPAGLAVDAVRGTVWFTEGFTDSIGRLEPKTGEIREWALSGQGTGVVSGPAGLGLDARGGVWFAKLEGKIGHLAPGADRPTVIDVPPEARRPAAIAVARDGDVWTLALDGNLALRYRPTSGTFTAFPLPTGSPDREPSVPPQARSARPFGIGFDRQGNLWFSEQYTGQLGVLDLVGPRVEIISPPSLVESLQPLLTTRVTDGVSGLGQVEIHLDGKPVPVRAGRLDLIGVRPGIHKLRVRATDRAGWTSTSEKSFEYRPDGAAFQEALSRLLPRGAPGRRLRDELVTLARQIGGQDARDTLFELRRRLVGCRGCFAGDPAAYQSLIDFQLARAAHQVLVRVLDQAPYFEPREVVLRPGDTLSCRYDAPTTGHVISTRSHTLKVEGAGRPGETRVLRAGEPVGLTFDSPGKFLVRNAGAPEAALGVSVRQP
jgi:streptogramin lyase